MSVNHDWDETAEFDRFRSFHVLEHQAVPDPLVARRITDAVRIHLTERNFTEDNDDPDFLVAVHTDVQDRVDVHSWGYSASSSSWHGSRDIRVTHYQQGTLLIDFVAADDKELFWRGWGSRQVTSSTREASVIQDAVDKILKQYPPK
jgi:hypothetical protein